MKTIKRTHTSLLGIALLAGGRGSVQAQNMRLVPSAFSGSVNTPVTLDVVVTGNIGSAVAWGTSVSFSDPLNMGYVPDVNGTGTPYLSLEPFFDLDFTDTSSTNNGILNFNFLNSTPGATYSFSGYTPLAEFQVLLGSGLPNNTLLTINLAPLGIPPLGSAVQDDSGNNLLLPADPSAPLESVATAYLLVTNGSRWRLSLDPPVLVPEPTGTLVLLGGAIGTAFLRRRQRRPKAKGRRPK